MKVAFVGNQDNNAYRCCVWLRDSGVEAHLYMIRQESGPRSRPEAVDVQLEGNYPDWIHQYDDTGRLSFLRPGRTAGEIEQEFDIVVTSGATGLLAANHFRRVPVVHLTLGSEVNDFPLRLLKLRAGGLKWRAAAWLMRRALRRVNRIVTHGFWPELQALEAMGLLDKTVIWGIPEDTRNNRSRVNAELLKQLDDKYSRYDCVFVWLSRLIFRDPASPEYKAVEKYLDAFERLALTDKANVRAIFGDHGTDAEAFRKLVTEKGLDGHVDWVPHLAFWELLTYCSITNAAIVDVPDMQRGHILGGLVREGLSVSAPVIAAWDAELVELCYGEGCPVLRAVDAESCYRAMRRVADMGGEEFARLKQQSAEWADKHLHYERRMGELISLLGQVAYCESFRGGRQE